MAGIPADVVKRASGLLDEFHMPDMGNNVSFMEESEKEEVERIQKIPKDQISPRDVLIMENIFQHWDLKHQ